MSSVTYTCSLCKKSKKIIVNNSGINRFGTCDITLGCTGTVSDDRIQTLTTTVGDWVPRPALLVVPHAISSSTWKINTKYWDTAAFLVYVHQYVNGVLTLQITSDFTHTRVHDELIITFPTNTTGEVHLLQSTSIKQPEKIVDYERVVVDNNNIITLAVPNKVFNTPNWSISFNAQYLNTSIVLTYADFIPNNNNTAWNYSDRAYVDGELCNIISFNYRRSGTGLSAFVSGLVGPGTTLELLSTSTTDNRIYLLLSHSPHKHVDKVLDEVFLLHDLPVGEMYLDDELHLTISNEFTTKLATPINIL